jgi:uncharacterized protein
MQNQNMDSVKSLFQSRLAMLEQLLKSAQTHFGDDESFLQQRLAADMCPFGTQIAFTCNQPRNFALWCDGKPVDDLDPDVTSLAQAYEHIANTNQLLSSIHAEDTKLDQMTRIYAGQNLYIDLSGSAYVNDFLMPNFYFHLVTAYALLRMAGVPLGKRDYMMHLVPLIRETTA